MTPQTHASAEVHKEDVFEAHIVECLIAEQGYEKRICAEHYDVAHAMDTELLFRFLRETQPDAWQNLLDHNPGVAEEALLKRITDALAEQPLHQVMRGGIKLLPNIEFDLCYFKPASNLNPELTEKYEANILSVMQQVKYSARNEKCIDIVLFVNGIPFATLEVKNPLTGQNFKDAERQYCTDRPPAGEPLLTFKRGAIVHFAVDPQNASMSTRLRNGRTHFLPFNRGRDGGAGNPDIADEHRTAYLYKDIGGSKAVFSREVLLSIIGRFIHLTRGDGKEAIIFPRFQQLDAVRRILDDVRAHGTGQSYLIQHSAGSGKSNTIAWAAHQIINLHDDNDAPLINTAIIVTDRIVLDKQLQDTIGGMAQTEGVVKKIEGSSKELREAIESGARIIITTIQKFGTEHLATLAGQGHKKFAVIIDEAHSSQSGKAGQAMTGALTRESVESPEDIEEAIAEVQAARGPQPHISYLAFTATPRNVTLERFGRRDDEGKPVPFHLYSMRQAIEEGFILDVLQNYMTYKAYYKLEKAIEDDPRFKGRKAQAKVARFASLHPTAIDQKIEVIVEHFRRHVKDTMGGNGKAMIVTQSREHALRYYLQIRDYIAEKRYNDVVVVVAFSGEVSVDGAKYTEAGLNEFSEKELPKKFNGDEINLLVVAEKYQTGFDQPKLAGMYVDKKLNGLQAVQTLSRLNRTHPEKHRTHILDFQNTMDDIKEAFKPYFEVSALRETTEYNQIYDLDARIRSADYIKQEDVEAFASIFFRGDVTTQGRAVLEQLVRNAVGRFVAEAEDAKQEEFRQLIKSYIRFYVFVAQVVRDLRDIELEKLYVYAEWLNRLLPGRIGPGGATVTDDMLELEAVKIEEKYRGSASLQAGETELMEPISAFGANPYTEEEQIELSKIIEAFNKKHGTQFSKEDFVRYERVNDEILRDERMIARLQNNPPDVVFDNYQKVFIRGMIRLFQQDSEMKSIMMTDREMQNEAIRFFFSRALRQVNKAG